MNNDQRFLKAMKIEPFEIAAPVLSEPQLASASDIAEALQQGSCMEHSQVNARVEDGVAMLSAADFAAMLNANSNMRELVNMHVQFAQHWREEADALERALTQERQEAAANLNRLSKYKTGFFSAIIALAIIIGGHVIFGR